MAWVKDVSLNANTTDTVKLIVDTTNDFYNSEHLKKYFNLLTGGKKIALEDFLQRIFIFAFNGFPYKMDEQGWEKIYTANKILRDGKLGIDCKKFTVFLTSMMKLAGIKYYYKVVSYDNGLHWSHIYPVVPISDKKYITLDPVNYGKYNQEVIHDKARLYYEDNNKLKYFLMNGNRLSQMGSVNKIEWNLSGMKDAIGQGAADFENELRVISGQESLHTCDCLKTENLNELAGINEMDETDYNDYLGRFGFEIYGLGRKKIVKKSKEERKEKRKKIIGKAKVGGFAIARAAFLGLIALGKSLKNSPLKLDLALRIAELYLKNPKAVTKVWEGVGGKMPALKKALEKSTGKKLNGMGAVTAASAVAAIAAATPIIIMFVKLFKENGILKGQTANVADKVVDTLEDLHVANGTPDPALNVPTVTPEQVKIIPDTKEVAVLTVKTDNEVIDDGADVDEETQAAKTTASGQTPAPQQGNILGGSLLSINTWLKAILVFGLISCMYTNLFGKICLLISSFSFVMLFVSLIVQSINLITKKKIDEI